MLSIEKQEPPDWIETQSNCNWNTTEQRQTQEEKNECRGNKGINIWKEDHITTTQEPKLENIQGRNRKNKSSTHISMNNNTELNEWKYAGVKLVSDQISVPQRNTNRTLKSGWEIKL